MTRRRRTGRSDPTLWERCKTEAISRLGGRHSARAMQLAGALYRERGGRYLGPKTPAQRKLSQWTREKWRTASGQRACKRGANGELVCDRYLPDAAWGMLTPEQARATQAKKRSASVQYVPNTAAAREAGRRARGRR